MRPWLRILSILAVGLGPAISAADAVAGGAGEASLQVAPEENGQVGYRAQQRFDLQKEADFKMSPRGTNIQFAVEL